jgi:tetratricopeptide (TPR) repeat protein
MESLSLAEQISDTQHAAICAFNMGRAHVTVDQIRDPDLAERWFKRGLETAAAEDRLGQARCLGELGSLSYGRFVDCLRGRPVEECLGYLAEAERCCTRALELFPATAAPDLATAHNLLGLICAAGGQIEAAIRHCQESIRRREAMRDPFSAGETRKNAAVALARVGRLAEAQDWAHSALRDFQACENAEREVVNTLKLLEEIESDPRASSQPLSGHPSQPH